MGKTVTGQRRQPKQDRATESRRRLLDAATQLFAERGISGTSTNRIAAAAGMSIGTLYRYFADREEIVSVLRNKVIGEIEHQVVSNVIAHFNEPPQETLTIAMRGVLTVLVDNAGLLRALIAESNLAGSGFAEFNRTLRLVCHGYLSGRLPPDTGADLDVMAYVVAHTCMMTCYGIAGGDAADQDPETIITATATMVGNWVEAAMAGAVVMAPSPAPPGL
ncbi:TetR/AcrR family transcriptional regulator [Nocardia stercoris]|uniref:TetR/AcrR family transcriptional regulator n=1 Tax=Nocardia stercoris TaxID=2483361 RepID=A0A3M2KYC8_9NOCA|nr:TetR/AcrR family transcriptional regulator [Nocardia stercoris]RMI30064.1 TetR/AcrR family transcriptional regulator [Nocardia stercoris]